MISKLIYVLKNKFLELKREIIDGKVMFGAVTGSVLIGGVLATANAPKEGEISRNFFAMVVSGNLNPIGYIFGILILFGLLYLGLYFSSYHLSVFILNLFIIMFESNMVFVITFKSISIDGILGILYLTVYILPIILHQIMLLSRECVEIFDMCCYREIRFSRVNVGCHREVFKKKILKLFITSLIFAYVHWFTEYIIVIIAVR